MQMITIITTIIIMINVACFVHHHPPTTAINRKSHTARFCVTSEAEMEECRTVIDALV